MARDHHTSGPYRHWIVSVLLLSLLPVFGVFQSTPAGTREALIQQLQSEDPVLRADAAHRLRRHKVTQEGLTALVAILGDRTAVSLPKEDHTDPGMEAARTLGSYGEDGVEALASVLDSASLEVRLDALKGLAFTGSRHAYVYLVKALSDTSWRIRERTVEGLGLFGNPAVVVDLTTAIQDDDPAVREMAAWAFGMISSPEGVAPLSRALSDPIPGVREKAAWALGMTGHKDAVPRLIASLKDETPGVREKAAWALGMIGDPVAAEPLRTLKKDRHEPKTVRDQADWALKIVAPPEGATTEIVKTQMISGEFPIQPGQELRLDLRYGSIRIEAADTEQVQAQVRVNCYKNRSRCNKLLEEVRLASSSSSETLELSVQGMSSEKAKQHLDVEATLTVPKRVPLSLALRGGEIDVHGMEGPLAVEIGVGDVDIELPRYAVSRVDLKSDINMPLLEGEGIEEQIQHHTRGKNGHQVRWTAGTGNADVEVKIGTGSILVRLL